MVISALLFVSLLFVFALLHNLCLCVCCMCYNVCVCVWHVWCLLFDVVLLVRVSFVTCSFVVLCLVVVIVVVSLFVCVCLCVVRWRLCLLCCSLLFLLFYL